MCALFGRLDYKHIVPYKVLKKLTQALANAAEECGTDATEFHISETEKSLFTNVLSPLIKSASTLLTVQRQLWVTPV